MPIVRRGAPLILVRGRRAIASLPMHGFGAAPNTLATGADAAAICAARNSILSAAGNCVSSGLATSTDIANQQQLLASLSSPLSAANVASCAPPVYTSSWTPSSVMTDWASPAYAINNQAQGTAGQVNAENARRYQGWQTSLKNWQMQGSHGSPPGCPTYVTFDQYWSTMNLGPAPASISKAAPGTPLPAGTILTGDLAAGGAGYPLSGPQATLPYPKQTAVAPKPVVQSNAPSPTPIPAASSQGQSNAPAPASVVPSSGGFLQILSGVLPGPSAAPTSTGITNWFDGIPNWAVIAAAGLGVILLWPKGGR